MAMPWEADVLRKLELRDRSQCFAFSELIESHTRLSRLSQKLEESSAALTEENAQLKESVDTLQRSVSAAAGKGGVVVNQKELDDAKAQLADYKERLLDALSKENQAHGRIDELTKTLRRRDEEMKKRDESDNKLHNQLFATEKQVKTLQELATKRERAEEVLRDELQSLQLELLNRDNKVKELEMDHKVLVEKWLQMLNDRKDAGPTDASIVSASAPTMAAGAAAAATPPTAATTNALEGDPLPAHNEVAAVALPTHSRKRFAAHESDINCIQVSASGRMFATGSNDRKIKIFDATGVLKSTIHGSQQSVMCVQFSQHDELILGGSNDHATRLWSVETGRMRHTLTGHVGKVFSAKFSVDSTRVVTGSHDRTLKVWDLQKGNCIRTIFSFSSCNDLCLTDDAGSTIVSGHLDQHVRIWDTKSGDCINEITGIHQGQITSLAMSPDSMNVLTNSRDNTLKLIDVRMLQTIMTYSHESYRTGMNWSRASFSPDGAYVVAGGNDGGVYIWNTLTGKCETVLSNEHDSSVAGVSWNAQTGYLYSADKNKTVVIWEP